MRDETIPEATVEGLAARHLEALREHQGRGPYFLGGWSFGGVVAYEMACRLAALGEEIGLLALIDSRAPGALPAPADPVEGATLVAMLAREIGAASDGVERSIDDIVERAKSSGLLPPEVGPAEIRRLLEVLAANLKALRSYLPGPYAGRVTLFRAVESTTLHRDTTLGWRALASRGVEVHEIPGDHYSMVREPHLRVLAERIKDCLDEALSSRGTIIPGAAGEVRQDFLKGGDD